MSSNALSTAFELTAALFEKRGEPPLTKGLDPVLAHLGDRTDGQERSKTELLSLLRGLLDQVIDRQNERIHFSWFVESTRGAQTHHDGRGLPEAVISHLPRCLHDAVALSAGNPTRTTGRLSRETALELAKMLWAKLDPEVIEQSAAAAFEKTVPPSLFSLARLVPLSAPFWVDCWAVCSTAAARLR